MKEQKEYIGPGAILNIRKIISNIEPKTIFLVTGKNSFHLSGADDFIKEFGDRYKFIHFSDFSPNPTLENLQRGLSIFRSFPIDLVLAIGGGSVIDMAKLINIFSVQEQTPTECIEERKKITKKGKPLIAVPTTAGSGSEATHFAVLYINKAKYSVAHEYVLPDYAIVDPVLTASLPVHIRSSTGMDALCQAIESYWSVNSTDISKGYSRRAIQIIVNNLENVVKSYSLESGKAMSKAAHLAGKAINITKTTAPHAISYVLTSYFDVAHGHAVGLTLGKILKYNSQINEKDVTDARGAEYVRKIIEELCSLLGAADPSKADEKLENLMKSIGLQTKLKDLGIKEKDLNLIMDNINLERLKNNPRLITKSGLKEILESIL